MQSEFDLSQHAVGLVAARCRWLGFGLVCAFVCWGGGGGMSGDEIWIICRKDLSGLLQNSPPDKSQTKASKQTRRAQ